MHKLQDLQIVGAGFGAPVGAVKTYLLKLQSEEAELQLKWNPDWGMVPRIGEVLRFQFELVSEEDAKWASPDEMEELISDQAMQAQHRTITEDHQRNLAARIEAGKEMRAEEEEVEAKLDDAIVAAEADES